MSPAIPVASAYIGMFSSISGPVRGVSAIEPVHHLLDAVGRPGAQRFLDRREEFAHRRGLRLPEIAEHVVGEVTDAALLVAGPDADAEPRIVLAAQRAFDALEAVV